MIERQSLTKAKYDNSKRWLGELPLHWKPTTVRAITKPITKRDRPDLPLLSVYRDYGVILKDSRDDNHNRPGENLSSYKVVEPGNLVLNKMKTWQGSLGVSELHGIVSPAYIVCELYGDINPRFIHYLLRSYRYIFEYNRISYGVRVDQWDMHYEDFKQIPIYLPPRPEQDAIVAFLDEKLADIDRYIAAKQRLIELLDEQKAAIINQAVTRGLDPAVKMKESGVEWLGEIPARWGLRRLRYLTSFVTSGSRGWAQYYADEGAKFIRVGNLSSGSDIALNMDDIQYVTPPDGAEGERTRVQNNDVLLAITGATIGSVATVDTDIGEAYVNQHTALIRPKLVDCLPKWIGYSIYAQPGQTQIRLLLNGGTKEGLGLDDVKNIVVLLPSISEQQAVMEQIEARNVQLDQLIKDANREIELMQELRTALIAEAVTGKIDVWKHTIE